MCGKSLEQIFRNVWKKYLEMFGIQTFELYKAVDTQFSNQIAMCLHILLRVCT